MNQVRAAVIACVVARLCLASQAFAATPDTAAPQISAAKKYVEISVTVDPALKPFVGLFANCLTEGKAWAAKMSETAEAEWRDNRKAFRGLKWSYGRHYMLRSAISRYVSVVRSNGTFEGGAHPSQEIDTILWDIAARKRISIRPFFLEMNDNGPTLIALAKLARLAVATKKLANGINGYGADDTPASKMTPEQELREDNFINDGVKSALLGIGPVTLAPSTESGKSAGLTFHYSPYGVGPYVEGPYTIFVAWTDFRQYLSPEGAALFGGTRPKSDEDKW